MLEIKIDEKSYGSKKILTDIHLKLEEGTLYGVVGANGAGKTTLFRCISGLEKYKGNTLQGFSLSYLETTPFFYPLVTGEEYLAFVSSARAASTPKIADWNDLFQLPLNQYIKTYSTGMKKKLGFLGVLLQDSQVILLDEPFNGVDLDTSILLQQILQILKKKGKILLVSSHIFSSLKEIADSILHLEKKCIFEIEKEDFEKLGNKLYSQKQTQKITTLLE